LGRAKSLAPISIKLDQPIQSRSLGSRKRGRASSAAARNESVSALYGKGVAIVVKTSLAVKQHANPLAMSQVSERWRNIRCGASCDDDEQREKDDLQGLTKTR
jgi:hypothetical protein